MGGAITDVQPTRTHHPVRGSVRVSDRTKPSSTMSAPDGNEAPEWELAQEWVASVAELTDAHPGYAADIIGELDTSRRRAARNTALAPVPLGPDEPHLARLEALVRWNAAMIVAHANAHSDGIGGHLSTYASSSTLFSIGWDYHFRGRNHPSGGDHVYFQGHASPGVYARAYAERRLSKQQLHLFRRETAGGLPSYPHPRLLSDFWEYPTVSMGLGPVAAIEQARLDRYLARRDLVDTSDQRVWAFLGDGECDEPETLGLIRSASRDRLDNLTFVVSCNLQRLDGQVNGSGSTIAELGALFEGAGWRVITLWWGPRWEPLLRAEPRLGWHLAGIADGDLQRLVADPDPDAIASELLGPYQHLIADWSEDDIAALPGDAGGADRALVHQAYTAATTGNDGRPAVILARTVKGHLLPHAGRNAAHQVKKLNQTALSRFAANLSIELTAEQTAAIDAGGYPLIGPDPAIQAALTRRAYIAGGHIPTRPPSVASTVTADLSEYNAGNTSPVSTTAVLTRILRTLAADPHVVPIVADEGRTFGFDPLYSERGVFSARPVTYQAVDAKLPLWYNEDPAGQVIQAGISEASAMGAFQAAGTAHTTHQLSLVPVYTFYSMFGLQRVGDLIWQAADARARGFLVGGTAGATTLAGEGLQHQDGHSLAWANNVPHLHAWDCAFAYELADVISWQLNRWSDNHDEMSYICGYNEPWLMPARPAHVTAADIISGAYRFDNPEHTGPASCTLMFSGPGHQAAFAAADALTEHGVPVALVAVTSWKALWLDALDAQRDHLANRESRRLPRVTQLLAGNGPAIAVTDWTTMLPLSVAGFAPNGLVALGTDGFGRSDDRVALRRHFNTARHDVLAAALAALRYTGESPAALEDAANHLANRFAGPGAWNYDS
jgi:pyruvate dehydrogenase E1 component